jgi:hypothetical protein
MQRIITRLGKKNKKEEKNSCRENVEKTLLCRRYTNVHYVVLCGKINVIFQREKQPPQQPSSLHNARQHYYFS